MSTEAHDATQLRDFISISLSEVADRIGRTTEECQLAARQLGITPFIVAGEERLSGPQAARIAAELSRSGPRPVVAKAPERGPGAEEMLQQGKPIHEIAAIMSQRYPKGSPEQWEEWVRWLAKAMRVEVVEVGSGQ